jgi:cbb3-type cytochrome oxidase subunit 3
MIRQFLANFPFVWMATTAQIIFLSVFVSSVLWIFRPRSKEFYADLSNLALDKDREDSYEQ